MTTQTLTQLPAQRTACPVCRKAHQPGSAAGAKCAAKIAPAVSTTSEHGDVTVADLERILDSYDLALVLVGQGDGLIAIVAPWWCAGEVLADGHDVAGLINHYCGSVAAAAADLSLAVRFEREMTL